MAQYNFDTIADFFTMALRNKDGKTLEYNIKYPTTEEMRAIVKSSNDLEELINNNATKEEIEKVTEESEKDLNDLISPAGHDVPFSEVFQNQNIRVQREFRKVIQSEFGGQQG